MAPPSQSETDAAGIASAKRLLRHAILLARESKPLDVRAAEDHSRFERLRGALEELDWRPHTVAAYLSTPTEPGTLELVGWLAAQRIQVLLPVLSSGGSRSTRPDWAPYAGPDQLRVGALSILEPTTPPIGSVAPGTAELVICSGLAADRTGNRLGRGGGWYDRTLAAASPNVPVWALLNDDEVLDTIPVDPWGAGVDAIVTPTQMITTGLIRRGLNRHGPTQRRSQTRVNDSPTDC
jgi:5-formyltetrahydrofolate cyclo-ligase